MKIEGVEWFFDPNDIEFSADIHKPDELVVVQSAGEIEHQTDLGSHDLAQGFDTINGTTKRIVVQLAALDVTEGGTFLSRCERVAFESSKAVFQRSFGGVRLTALTPS